jgi:hypothetical protein
LEAEVEEPEAVVPMEMAVLADTVAVEMVALKARSLQLDQMEQQIPAVVLVELELQAMVVQL